MFFNFRRSDIIPVNGGPDIRCVSVDDTEDDKSSIADSFVDADADSCCTSCHNQRLENNHLQVSMPKLFSLSLPAGEKS